MFNQYGYTPAEPVTEEHIEISNNSLSLIEEHVDDFVTTDTSKTNSLLLTNIGLANGLRKQAISSYTWLGGRVFKRMYVI